ncbi:MAG: polysaccharide deacetylase family protein [Trueperaceae bacterium]|nr:polysaccharide deacetylase family protein [Trueperaceae bacterium]
MRDRVGALFLALWPLPLLLGMASADVGVVPPSSAAVPYAPAVAVIDLFGPETRFAHQTAAGRSAVVDADTVRGEGTLRITSDGDGQQVNVRATAMPPIDLRDAHLRLLLRVDHPERLEHLLLYLSSDGFAGYETYRVVGGPEDGRTFVLPDQWLTVTVALGTPLARVGDGVDLARVSDVQLSLVDLGDGPVTAHVDALEAVARPARGVVSLVFDDARDGAYRHARPLLDRHGLRASVAAIVELVGTPGFMSLDELRSLERFAGWDVVAHHVSPLPDEIGFADLDDDAVLDELLGARAWLLAHGFRRGADHLVYPYGGFDARAIELVRSVYASGRTIVRGLGLETLPPADPYRIRALSVTRDDPPEALTAAIDRAAREHAWLVLVFHQLVDGSPDDDTGYRVDDLAAVVAHLAAADVDVLTLPEALTAGR